MYILFGSSQYYANGGFNDFLGAFEYEHYARDAGKQYINHGFVGCFGEDSEDYCNDYYSSKRIEWWHVLCVETMQIVAKSRAIPFGED